MHRSAKSRTDWKERNRPMVRRWMSTRCARSICGRRTLAVLRNSFRRVHEKALVRLDLLQSDEPTSPGPLQVLLQGVEEHAGGLRGGAQPHVLHVRVQHEGDVGRDVHALPVHRAHHFHQTVEKAVQRRALKRVGKGDVVALRIEAREAVTEEREQGLRRGKHDERRAVGILQRRVQGKDLAVRVGAAGKPRPGPGNCFRGRGG